MYTLFNKKMKKCLTHPQFGIWCTADIDEAREMLRACRECGGTYGYAEDNFAIVEVESKKVVDE